ncbi:uncharacterized protein LOC124326644 [Daphnia pulicaria]|uniref:uncharacterized protein LOC124326644 n=1 Tax=Daphnia pulicaria TaxID=35523 RepID=UPI001EE9B993|nr:uncharacterized protein LOC124326644 [Daphnia pulicaria]
MQSHKFFLAMLVVVMVSLATAAPVPGYKMGSDPNAEAPLHRNIKKEYGNEKRNEALKNSNVKFVQAEEKAFAAKNPSAAVIAPAVVSAKKPIIIEAKPIGVVAPDRKCPPPKQMDPMGKCREPWGR